MLSQPATGRPRVLVCYDRMGTEAPAAPPRCQPARVHTFCMRVTVRPGAEQGAAAAAPEVWYDPNPFLGPHHATPGLFPLLTSPEKSYPQLASRISGFKMFIDMLYTAGEPGLPAGRGTTDAELSALI